MYTKFCVSNMHITVDSLMEAIKKDPTILKEEAAVVKDDVAEGRRIDAQAKTETVSSGGSRGGGVAGVYPLP